MFVVTGVDSKINSSVEILTEDEFGQYTPCSAVSDFPVATSSATGAVFNALPHVCVGHKEGDPSKECIKFTTDGSWENDFNLTKPLKQWGSSVIFGDWGGAETAWWIVGGDPDGKETEVWGGNPPTEISNGVIKLPKIINQPCMMNISEHEAFVTAIPKFEGTETNLAWIFNIQSNTWTSLPNTLERRTGPACGFLKTTARMFFADQDT